MDPRKIAADYSASTPAPPSRAVAVPRQAQVPAACAGMRVDQALARLFPDFSRSRLQQWVRQARVTLDGASTTPSARVWGGEHVQLVPELETEGTALPEDIPLRIVHEDDALIVIDKPAGLVVHPGNGHRTGTLMNALLHHAPELTSLPRAGIVHRLDRDTSGLLAVARSLTSQTSLVRQLQARSVTRIYLALVAGVPAPTGTVEAPIGRHPQQRTRMAVVPAGKPAMTHYRTLESGNGWSLLECRLETGRTHQIRVHLAQIGHPLIGDPVYLPRHVPRNLPAAARDFRRQALHATALALVHPSSLQTLQWHSPLPPDMQDLLQQLQDHAPAS